MGVERTPKKSQHTSLTLMKKILPPLLSGFEFATFDRESGALTNKLSRSQWPLAEKTGGRSLLNCPSCPPDNPIGQGTELKWMELNYGRRGLEHSAESFYGTVQQSTASRKRISCGLHLCHGKRWTRALPPPSVSRWTSALMDSWWSWRPACHRGNYLRRGSEWWLIAFPHVSQPETVPTFLVAGKLTSMKHASQSVTLAGEC